jgi:hypothetical protein
MPSIATPLKASIRPRYLARRTATAKGASPETVVASRSRRSAASEALLLARDDRFIQRQLITNHLPAADEIFQDGGFGFAFREGHQPATFGQLILASFCAVHFPAALLARGSPKPGQDK